MNELNMFTIKFISMLNELARMSAVNYTPWSKYDDNENCDGIVYDDEHKDEYGYPIVLYKAIGVSSKEIISTYDDYCGEGNGKYIVRVYDDLEDLSIIVYIAGEDGVLAPIERYRSQFPDEMIYIEDGEWYM